MKYFVIAGEVSGDLHGSKLIAELKKKDPHLKIRAWGGDKIANKNVPIDKHIKELAFMGFTEVVKNIGKIMRNFKTCKKNIKDFNPDAIILIDYPGFNLRIAKWAKKQNYKVLYFISPAIWAWNTKRVYTVKKSVDKMYVILPFEKQFYQKFEVDVEYYGNPLLQTIKEHTKPDFNNFCKENQLSGNPIIALLPGSREQEVKVNLEIMMQTAKNFVDYEFVIAGSENVDKSIYNKITGEKDIKILFNKTYDLFSIAEAGIIKSGTGTLEAALFGLPQIVCYKGGTISIAIARMLAKVKYISLVNLIAEKEVVKELIQNDFTEFNATGELKKILKNGSNRDQIIKDYKKLYDILGDYDSYKCIAESIDKTMNNEQI